MIPQQLEKLLTDYQDSLPELRLNEHLAEIRGIAEDISQHQFSIAVVGEFSTGKSTLINALIGRDLLPAHAIPTTKRITTISFGDADSLTASPASTEKLALSSENICSLTADPDVYKIEIKVTAGASQSFRKFKIIDTPGANDPTELDDEIIINIFDQADVILFVLNVNQAYKRTEQEFLKRAVVKKDLAKFFFLLNFGDTSAEGFKVRKSVIERLKNDLGADEAYLKNHVLIISARRALEALLAGDKERLTESGYDRLSELVNLFVAENSGRLLTDAFKCRVLKDLDELLVEINLLQDQYKRGLSGQENGLGYLDSQIKSIELEIDADRTVLLGGIKREKQRLSDRLTAGCDLVADKVITFIDQEAPDAALNPRTVEVYSSKLLRELVGDEFNRFQEGMQGILGQFDVALDECTAKTPVMFQTHRNSHYLKSGLKIAGVGTAGLVAVTYGPVVAGIAATGALLSTICGGIASITGIMGILTLPAWGVATIGFASAAGAVASGAVSGAWSLLKSTAKEMGKWADEAEKAIGRSSFKRHIRSSLVAIRDELIVKINQTTDEQINAWIDDHISSRFPQKKLLERHRTEVTDRLKEDRNQVVNRIANLESFRTVLEVDRDLLANNFFN